MTAATIPFVGSSSAGSSSVASPGAFARAAGRQWIPSDRDRLVFQWVKFEGKTQSWVAEQLEIHQSTVSRMVERYERWIASGGPARQGGLTHEERRRAQKWLTYERNEWILGAALRRAAAMETPVDATKSTVSRSAASPSQETEIRTEHMTVDRSGAVARYLRLAHRVNMENLKLVGEDPLPDLEPLTMEHLGEDCRPALVVETSAEESRAGCARQNEAAIHEAFLDDPALLETHNAAPAESTVTPGVPDSSGEIGDAEKAAGDACAVVVLPPATTASADSASELFCLAPRMESVALAIVRRLSGGQLPDGIEHSTVCIGEAQSTSGDSLFCTTVQGGLQSALSGSPSGCPFA